MASSPEHVSMALFCDFENVALGVRDAKYDKFDIKRILERLLLKGSIVVKKAYCDWDRYKGFKATMHEANFELIEIPHVRQSGKNSADIRLVVDALDLCYTKSHVDTFVIISGDSDFSPLVSKLRENAKQVIGVGVKQSTSDLLIANCDEFIFYDDLVRDTARTRGTPEAPAASHPRRAGDDERQRKAGLEARRAQGLEIAAETFDALLAERGDGGKIWASVLKEAIKRRRPDFSESTYGFRTFGGLLEEAQARGLLAFGRDEKSGAYVFRPHTDATRSEAPRPDLRPTPPAVERERRTPPATESTPTEAPPAVSADAPAPETVATPALTARAPRRRGTRRPATSEASPSETPAPLHAEAPPAASRYFSAPLAVAPTPPADPEPPAPRPDDTNAPDPGTEPAATPAKAPSRRRTRNVASATATVTPPPGDVAESAPTPMAEPVEAAVAPPRTRGRRRRTAGDAGPDR